VTQAQPTEALVVFHSGIFYILTYIGFLQIVLLFEKANLNRYFLCNIWCAFNSLFNWGRNDSTTDGTSQSLLLEEPTAAKTVQLCGLIEKHYTHDFVSYTKWKLLISHRWEQIYVLLTGAIDSSSASPVWETCRVLWGYTCIVEDSRTIRRLWGLTAIFLDIFLKFKNQFSETFQVQQLTNTSISAMTWGCRWNSRSLIWTPPKPL
jgi:hypothetical protein